MFVVVVVVVQLGYNSLHTITGADYFGGCVAVVIVTGSTVCHYYYAQVVDTIAQVVYDEFLLVLEPVWCLSQPLTYHLILPWARPLGSKGESQWLGVNGTSPPVFLIFEKRGTGTAFSLSL